jgi:hypothetical protein
MLELHSHVNPIDRNPHLVLLFLHVRERPATANVQHMLGPVLPGGNRKKTAFNSIKSVLIFNLISTQIRFKCKKLKNNEISGNLCMDLCYKETLELPKCGYDLIASMNTSYEFYKTFKSEDSVFICPKTLTDKRVTLKSGISVQEFENLLTSFIKERINDSKTAEEIVRRVYYVTDSNHDSQVCKKKIILKCCAELQFILLFY